MYYDVHSLMYSFKYSFSVVVLCFFLVGCSSTEKILERGDYVSVINRLDFKAEKGTLVDDDVSLLLHAINKKLDRESIWLEQNLQSKDSKNWIAGYQHLDKINDMQIAYSSFTQIDQYRVNWIDIQKWDMAYGDVLGEHHKESFDILNEKYLETNNKNYLIEAYFELDKIAHFSQEKFNVDSLQSSIEKEGVRKINLAFVDESSNLYELRHLKYYMDPSNSKWSNFGTFESPDFTVFIILEELEKDEQMVQNQVEYTYDVIVDYEIQIDGNGDDVPVPITEPIFALVNEVQFQYTVDVKGRVDIYLHNNSQLVSSEIFRKEEVTQEVEHYLIDGDIQAIPPNISLNVGTPNTITYDYNYDFLIEDTLEQVSEVIELYLENW